MAFALGEEGVSVAVCALDENELERTAKERRSCVTNHLDEYKQLTLVGAEMYN